MIEVKETRSRLVNPVIDESDDQEGYKGFLRIRCDVCGEIRGFNARQRIKKFFVALQDNSEEFERMKNEVDEDYANEKLRLKAERVTGMEIKYLYEAEARREDVL